MRISEKLELVSQISDYLQVAAGGKEHAEHTDGLACGVTEVIERNGWKLVTRDTRGKRAGRRALGSQGKRAGKRAVGAGTFDVPSEHPHKLAPGQAPLLDNEGRCLVCAIEGYTTAYDQQSRLLASLLQAVDLNGAEETDTLESRVERAISIVENLRRDVWPQEDAPAAPSDPAMQRPTNPPDVRCRHGRLVGRLECQPCWDGE